MVWMIVPGIISLLWGCGCVLAPQRFLQPTGSKRRGRWIEVNAVLARHTACTGICLIVIGLFCLASAWYVWLRLHA